MGKLDKTTQIVVVVGLLAVAAYGVNQIAKGINQAEANVGQGIGNGVDNVLTLGALGGLAWIFL